MTTKGSQEAVENAGNPTQMQRVVVMRHGRRYDSDNPLWLRAAEHPWDTPLARRGIKELEEQVGPKLLSLRPTVIVVSPFLRCLLTTRHLLLSWGASKSPGLRIIVDRQVSEVYSPYLLHLTNHPSCTAILRRWWWQHKWKQRAKEVLGSLEGCCLEFADERGWPVYPEDKLDGRFRFQQAMQFWPRKLLSGGQGNILMVTHGDAVLSGVNTVQAFLDVDNVQPGGFMVMARSVGVGASPLGPWQADKSLLKWHGVETTRRELTHNLSGHRLA